MIWRFFCHLLSHPSKTQVYSAELGYMGQDHSTAWVYVCCGKEWTEQDNTFGGTFRPNMPDGWWRGKENR